MGPLDRPAIVHEAVRLARRNRRLRAQFGLGVIGWLLVTKQVIDLILAILAILEARQDVGDRFGAARLKAYRLIDDGQFDADLLWVVEEAEFNITGI